MNRKNYLFKLIPILVIVAMILAVFATGGVAAEGSTSCAGPFPSITTLPYNDTGDTSNATTDNIPSYPGSGLGAFVYANDLVYEITLGEGNSVAFTAPGTAGVTDIAIFLVTACNDGTTWVAHSQDSIDDANPEVIAEDTYPAGTYYLMIDSYASDPGYPKYGAYSLEITGSLGDVATPTASATLSGSETPTATPSETLAVTPTATATVEVTVAVTATATATEDTGVELVGNGGFEADDSAPRAPVLDPWALKNAVGDKVKCNTETKVVANSGLCAFQFKGGAGEATKIQQNLDLSTLTLSVGDTFDLSAFVNAKKATASGKIKMTVKYNDATEAQKVSLAIVTTEGYVELVGETVTLAGTDVSKIKLMVKNSSPEGKVYVDDVSVDYAPVAAVSGLGRSGSQLIPLP